MPALDDSIHSYTIAPGIELKVDTMPQASGLAIGLWFSVGSAYERDGERGLSHFVEHMVFKGAGERSAEELSRAIDRVGGYLNAFTERETVCLHCLIPVRHAQLALGILLDMAYRPRFDIKEFEREKDVIINEILAAEDDLEEAAQDEFFASAYSGHPASRRIAASVSDIRGASFETLRAFHDERFVRGSLTVSVAGAVIPDDIARMVESALPSSRGTAAMAPYDPGPVHFKRTRRMVKAQGSQVFLFSGLPIDLSVSEDDFWRYSAASSAYGESMSSRLFMHIREEKGLCYSVSSAFSLSKLAGLWGVASSTRPAQLPRLIEAYAEESRLLFERGLTEVELQESVSRIKGILELAKDDTEYRMKKMARQYMFDQSVESFGQTMERLESGNALEFSAIDTLIKTSLDPDKESILLYGKLGARSLRAGEAVFGAIETEAEDYSLEGE